MVDFLTPMTAGLIMLAGGIPPLVTVAWLWNDREKLAVLWFQLMMLSGMFWSVLFGLVTLVESPQLRFVITNFLIVTGPVAGICYFMLCYEFTFKKRYPTIALGLFVPVVAMFVLAWVNPADLIYTVTDPHLTDEILIPPSSGSIRPMVNLGVGYLPVILGSGMVLGELLTTSQRVRKVQGAIILMSSITVAAIWTIKSQGLVPAFFDPTPIGWTLSGLLFAVSIKRYRFLQQSPTAHDHLLNEVDDALIVVSSEDVVTDANATATDCFDVDIGMSNAELTERNPKLATVLNGQPPDTIAVETGDRRRFFDTSVSTLEYGPDTEGRLALLRDITERKRAEQAVEETKAYYQRLFERSSDYVVVIDETGTIVDVTQGITHVLGYDPEEVIGTEALSYIHPADTDQVSGVLEDVIEQPSTEMNVEYRVRAEDGSYRWIEARGNNHLDDPLLGGLVANVRDISERKAAEQAAEETKQYYDRIFQQSSDYVLILDRERTVKDITQGIKRVLGYDPDELIGTDAFSHVHPEDRARVADTVAEIIQHPEANKSVEFRSQTKDGSYRWMEARGTNHLDDPVLSGLVATVRDVSERKEREQQLESLTTRFELVLEETNSGLWEWTPSNEEIILDDACQQLIGYEPGEFSAASADFRQRVHDDDLPAVEAAIEEAVATDSLYQADFRVELPGGEQRWIQSRGIVEYDEDGAMDRMLGIKTDITERKRAEQVVEETKQYYQRLFEQSSDFVLVVDEEATIIDITQGVEHVMGHDPDEMIGTDALSNVHPDDKDLVTSAMVEVIENPETNIDIEYRSQASDGSYRWLEARGSNHLDDPLLGGLVANVRDISERKEREQELETLTTRLELTLEETDTGVWEWDLDTDELIWDEACERLFGYEPGGFPGTYEEVARRLSDEDLAAFERAVTEAIDDDSRLQFEFSIELPDGEERWIQSRGVVEYDADGDAERMRGIKTDITDQKEAEQAVEETKRYYQRLFQQSSDYVTVIDEAGTITDITPGVKQALGYEPEELIDTNAFSFIHPDDCERIRGVLADVVENPDRDISMEYRARTETGDYRWMEARGSNYLDDPLLDGIVVYVRDVTQQKERQQELATKTARLQLKNEQLERLAQIVSHDLQTPLSTAEKLTELLRADLSDPEPAIEQSLDDLDATHRRLRSFADHLPRLARESTDIEESTACDLRSVAEAAWTVVDTGPLALQVESTRTLSGDPERLQRAFENLFQNAVTHGVEAVTETRTNESTSGGQSVEDRPPEDDAVVTATTVRVGSVENGFYIEDDGPGIRPEQHDELFEYGMGTGSGSGYGLAIVRTIIEAHGWTISVTNSTRGGARFEVETGS